VRKEYFRKSDQNMRNLIVDLKELKNKYLNETSNQYHSKLEEIKNKASILKK
jgi:hypothetical protein